MTKEVILDQILKATKRLVADPEQLNNSSFLCIISRPEAEHIKKLLVEYDSQT